MHYWVIAINERTGDKSARSINPASPPPNGARGETGSRSARCILYRALFDSGYKSGAQQMNLIFDSILYSAIGRGQHGGEEVAKLLTPRSSGCVFRVSRRDQTYPSNLLPVKPRRTLPGIGAISRRNKLP